jgi:glycerophosphodiester phosphodiesterase
VLTVPQVQRNEGIDAVIVDSVLRVRKGLQGPSQGVNGATLVVPSDSVPTINEATEALQGLDMNSHVPNPAEQTQVV